VTVMNQSREEPNGLGRGAGGYLEVAGIAGDTTGVEK